MTRAPTNIDDQQVTGRRRAVRLFAFTFRGHENQNCCTRRAFFTVNTARSRVDDVNAEAPKNLGRTVYRGR